MGPLTAPDLAQEAVYKATSTILNPEEVHLLTEIGFLAAASGDAVHAESIFGALQQLRPTKVFPKIGMAVTWMNAGRTQEAIALLEQAEKKVDEDVDVLQAWRGFALQRAGLFAESQRVLKGVAQSNNTAGALARKLLGNLEEIV